MIQRHVCGLMLTCTHEQDHKFLCERRPGTEAEAGRRMAAASEPDPDCVLSH